MIPYLRRVKYAFRSFFSILDHSRVPNNVYYRFPSPGSPASAPPQPAPAPRVESPDRATQLLALLQRDGRLVDFLMEDLTPYADAQIGAAVRDVHAGSRKAIERYVTLRPVIDDEEGRPVPLEPRSDAARIKVVGEQRRAPQRGVLRHRGWEASTPQPAAAPRHRPQHRRARRSRSVLTMACTLTHVSSSGSICGTTNCALAWVDTAAEEAAPRFSLQDIPQLVNPGEVGARPLLPSFLYMPGESDFPAGSLALPWDRAPAHVDRRAWRGGAAPRIPRAWWRARSRGCRTAARDRTAPILPWGAPAEVPHISPVDASAAYLRQLAAAFDREVAGGKRDARAVAAGRLLTVPASFDEEARELTLRGRRRGRARSTSRCSRSRRPRSTRGSTALGDSWRRRVAVGDLILVCDVGGGTTDFSLIAVAERDGDLALERVAVGEHILLGGDNMDLALARLLQQRLEAAGHTVDTWQLHGLWHQCRLAKEALLTDPVAARAPGDAARPRLEADRRRDHDRR